MYTGWQIERSRRGWFRCLPCDKAVEHRYVESHEGTAAHLKRLPFWLAEGQNTRDSRGAGDNSHSFRSRTSSQAPVVRGSLARILANISGGQLSHAPKDTSQDSQPVIGVDWEAADIQQYTQESTYERNAVKALAEDLQRYILDSGAVDMDSDEEDAEIDDAQGEQESDTGNMLFSLGDHVLTIPIAFQMSRSIWVTR